MKIIFDIDGTMTDYHAYIETYALPWFYKRYGLRPCGSFRQRTASSTIARTPFYADSPHGRSVSWPTFRSIVRPMIQTQITWPPSGIWRAFWGYPRRLGSSERVRPDARRAETLGCSTGRSPSWPKGPVPGYSRSRSAGERPGRKESSPSSTLGRRLRSAIRMSDPLWIPSCRSRERG